MSNQENQCLFKRIKSFFAKEDERKLLVHFHLYYIDQLDYFKKKLSNITLKNWTLYITMTEDNQDIKEKILDYKPDAQIIIVENKGYDIYPFLRVLQLVDLKHYDFILKVHTKNKQNNKNITNFYQDYLWRDALVNAILTSKSQFNKCLNIFKRNYYAGMIGSDKCYCLKDGTAPEDTYLYTQACNKFNLPSEPHHFICGTMFICRANLMDKIKEISFLCEANDFSVSKKTGDTGTLAHVFERLFGAIVELQNYSIIGISEPECSFLERIFSVKTTTHNKIYRILGIKISMNKDIAA